MQISRVKRVFFSQFVIYGYIENFRQRGTDTYLKQTKFKNGRVNVSITESFRDEDKKLFTYKIPNRTSNRKNVGSAVITRMTNDLLVERPIKI